MRHKDDNHVESKRRVRDNRMERDDRRLRLGKSTRKVGVTLTNVTFYR